MSERRSIDTVLLDEEIFESIVGYGIQAEEVEARVENRFYELTKTEEPILHLTVCVEASDPEMVRSGIRTALSDAGILGVTPNLYVRWYRSARERREEEVRAIVKGAIERSTRSYTTTISILLSGNNLHIRIVSRSFGAQDMAAQARQDVEQVKDDLLSTADALHMSIRLDDGMRPFPQHRAGGLDGDDDDEINPTWPSRTGNPSGGGRGNNPPNR